MTPAQEKALAVALDQLRESGVDPADVVRALYDEATAARMLRAVDGRIEAALIAFMTAHDDADDAGDYRRTAAELREVAILIEYGPPTPTVCDDCHVHPCNCGAETPAIQTAHTQHVGGEP